MYRDVSMMLCALNADSGIAKPRRNFPSFFFLADPRSFPFCEAENALSTFTETEKKKKKEKHEALEKGGKWG